MALYNQTWGSIASQFGMPLFGIAGLPPFTGNYFWVDGTNGSDGNNGGPQDPLKTLGQALSAATASNNDVIFLTGTVSISATLAWNKAQTHLVGLAPSLTGPGSALITQTGTVFTPLVNVTASGCKFINISAIHGFNNASAQVCWTDSGGKNEYTNCAFQGMNHATAAAQTGGRSLTIATAGDNTFTNCKIGLDSIVRSAANASLELLTSTPRNIFRGCIFPCNTSSASAVWVNAGATSMTQWAIFDDCVFVNSVDDASASTVLTAGITGSATMGGSIVLNNCITIGATAVATAQAIYGNQISAAGATTTYIGLKLT